MRKFTAAALIVLCALMAGPLRLCASPGGSAKTANASPVEKGLTLWFEGKDDEAEKIFNQLIRDNTPNPVVYHALAVQIMDSTRDYPRAAKLYNRHRALLPDHSGDYKAVIPLLEHYAAQGSPQALLMCARLNQWGLASSYDFSRGMILLRRAADGGYAQAQRELGNLYESGTAVVKDLGKAKACYSAAALQHDAPAMKDLAALLLRTANGNGAQTTEGLRLLRAAADAHLADAQMTFAKLYSTGTAVKKNEAEARRWCRLAAQSGSAEAMYALGWLYEAGHGVKKSPSKASEWYEKAAENSEPNALFRLGVLYYMGRGVAKDHARAYGYFSRSAKQGHPTAWYNVGWMSRTGDGTAKDFEEARKWFVRAAMTGNAEASVNLGMMYANGEGVEADLEEAFYWFELARLTGNKDSRRHMEKIKPHLDAKAQDRALRRAQSAFKRFIAVSPKEQ
ncbi:MAG: hypothetical protein ACOYD9_08055 [Pyramidobacter sp.]|jgi:TPR repeat protein